MKKKGILERLKEGPVLGDGGYLLELEKRGWVRAGDGQARGVHCDVRAGGDEYGYAFGYGAVGFDSDRGVLGAGGYEGHRERCVSGSGCDGDYAALHEVELSHQGRAGAAADYQ